MAIPNPEDRKYTATHEWLKLEGEIATCGITDHAQHLLTDIVFIELPAPGQTCKQGERIAVVESVKSVSDIYTPVSGEIVEVNTKLAEQPELINQDAFGAGWIFKIKPSQPQEIAALLTSADYEKLLRGE